MIRLSETREGKEETETVNGRAERCSAGNGLPCRFIDDTIR